MKLRVLFSATLIWLLPLAAGQGQNRPAPNTSASDIPHLRKQGTATQLIVDGKPFLALAGELLNSSATSIEYMKSVWPKLAEAKLNTILPGVSWNQIEPREGRFDFSVLDGIIRDARTHNMRLVLLWFGSWKNSLSGYAPDWVKRDFERFPRAQVAGGKNIELLSPLSDANRDADARAFAAMMRHVKAVDGLQHTVIMIQVENEVGMHGDSRDRSPAANQAFAGAVPKELMDYLQKHKDTLIPEFRQVWEAAGFKTSGTWEEVFGQSRVTDGIFMAWNYARYIGRVVEAGKAEYPIPMFANAALYRLGGGQPPASGGRPWDLVMDVWRAGGPQIDFLGPDPHSVSDYAAFCAKYTQSGNPLFIPETNGGPGSAARMIYAFGRYDAIGYSPFAIDRWAGKDPELAGVDDLLSRMAPLIVAHQGKGTMSAVLLGPNDPPRKVHVGNYTLEASYLTPPVMPANPPPRETMPTSAAILIASGPDEYFIAGSGVKVTFSPNTPGPAQVGLGTVEEGAFVSGRWVPGRQLAGDDTGQGEYVGLWGHWKSAGWPGDVGPENLFLRDLSIQRVTLYRYP
jgi:hypothetical protein